MTVNHELAFNIVSETLKNNSGESTNLWSKAKKLYAPKFEVKSFDIMVHIMYKYIETHSDEFKILRSKITGSKYGI